MTDEAFDRQVRDFLAREAADTSGAPSAYEIATRISSSGGMTSIGLRVPPRLMWVVLTGLLIAALVGAALIGASLLRPRPLGGPSNGWIAFSTQPGWPQVGHDYNGVGGDIYLVREGVEPKLIVSRGPENASNVCPAFSPDGSTLVYGTRDGLDRALVFLTVSADGTVSENRRLDAVGLRAAPCPRWSGDGTRIAYLEGDSLEYVEPSLRIGLRVIVSGLDGQTLEAGADDPSVGDLKRDPFDMTPLRSPAGNWVALGDDRGAVVQRPDGSDVRVVMSAERLGALLGYPSGFALNPFAIPAWSPDGKYVLVMGDVSGLDFAIVAVEVESPFESLVLAPMVAVNSASASSFPGRGDVSWQPVYE